MNILIHNSQNDSDDEQINTFSSYKLPPSIVSSDNQSLEQVEMQGKGTDDEVITVSKLEMVLDEAVGKSLEANEILRSIMDISKTDVAIAACKREFKSFKFLAPMAKHVAKCYIRLRHRISTAKETEKRRISDPPPPSPSHRLQEDPANSINSMPIPQPTLPATETHAIGSHVEVASRTWSGINRPGGAALITGSKVNPVNAGEILYSVKYFMGGREDGVAGKYVRAADLLGLQEGGRRAGRDRTTTGRCLVCSCFIKDCGHYWVLQASPEEIAKYKAVESLKTDGAVAGGVGHLIYTTEAEQQAAMELVPVEQGVWRLTGDTDATLKAKALREKALMMAQMGRKKLDERLDAMRRRSLERDASKEMARLEREKKLQHRAERIAAGDPTTPAANRVRMAKSGKRRLIAGSDSFNAMVAKRMRREGAEGYDGSQGQNKDVQQEEQEEDEDYSEDEDDDDEEYTESELQDDLQDSPVDRASSLAPTTTSRRKSLKPPERRAEERFNIYRIYSCIMQSSSAYAKAVNDGEIGESDFIQPEGSARGYLLGTDSIAGTSIMAAGKSAFSAIPTASLSVAVAIAELANEALTEGCSKASGMRRAVAALHAKLLDTERRRMNSNRLLGGLSSLDDETEEIMIPLAAEVGALDYDIGLLLTRTTRACMDVFGMCKVRIKSLKEMSDADAGAGSGAIDAEALRAKFNRRINPSYRLLQTSWCDIESSLKIGIKRVKEQYMSMFGSSADDVLEELEAPDSESDGSSKRGSSLHRVTKSAAPRRKRSSGSTTVRKNDRVGTEKLRRDNRDESLSESDSDRAAGSNSDSETPGANEHRQRNEFERRNKRHIKPVGQSGGSARAVDVIVPHSCTDPKAKSPNKGTRPIPPSSGHGSNPARSGGPQTEASGGVIAKPDQDTRRRRRPNGNPLYRVTSVVSCRTAGRDRGPRDGRNSTNDENRPSRQHHQGDEQACDLLALLCSDGSTVLKDLHTDLVARTREATFVGLESGLPDTDSRGVADDYGFTRGAPMGRGAMTEVVVLEPPGGRNLIVAGRYPGAADMHTKQHVVHRADDTRKPPNLDPHPHPNTNMQDDSSRGASHMPRAETILIPMTLPQPTTMESLDDSWVESNGTPESFLSLLAEGALLQYGIMRGRGHVGDNGSIPSFASCTLLMRRGLYYLLERGEDAARSINAYVVIMESLEQDMFSLMDLGEGPGDRTGMIFLRAATTCAMVGGTCEGIGNTASPLECEMLLHWTLKMIDVAAVLTQCLKKKPHSAPPAPIISTTTTATPALAKFALWLDRLNISRVMGLFFAGAAHPVIKGLGHLLPRLGVEGVEAGVGCDLTAQLLVACCVQLIECTESTATLLVANPGLYPACGPASPNAIITFRAKPWVYFAQCYPILFSHYRANDDNARCSNDDTDLTGERPIPIVPRSPRDSVFGAFVVPVKRIKAKEPSNPPSAAQSNTLPTRPSRSLLKSMWASLLLQTGLFKLAGVKGIAMRIPALSIIFKSEDQDSIGSNAPEKVLLSSRGNANSISTIMAKRCSSFWSVAMFQLLSALCPTQAAISFKSKLHPNTQPNVTHMKDAAYHYQQRALRGTRQFAAFLPVWDNPPHALNILLNANHACIIQPLSSPLTHLNSIASVHNISRKKSKMSVETVPPFMSAATPPAWPSIDPQPHAVLSQAHELVTWAILLCSSVEASVENETIVGAPVDNVSERAVLEYTDLMHGLVDSMFVASGMCAPSIFCTASASVPSTSPSSTTSPSTHVLGALLAAIRSLPLQNKCPLVPTPISTKITSMSIEARRLKQALYTSSFTYSKEFPLLFNGPLAYTPKITSQPNPYTNSELVSFSVSRLVWTSLTLETLLFFGPEGIAIHSTSTSSSSVAPEKSNLSLLFHRILRLSDEVPIPRSQHAAVLWLVAIRASNVLNYRDFDGAKTTKPGECRIRTETLGLENLLSMLKFTASRVSNEQNHSRHPRYNPTYNPTPNYEGIGLGNGDSDSTSLCPWEEDLLWSAYTGLAAGTASIAVLYVEYCKAKRQASAPVATAPGPISCADIVYGCTSTLTSLTLKVLSLALPILCSNPTAVAAIIAQVPSPANPQTPRLSLLAVQSSTLALGIVGRLLGDLARLPPAGPDAPSPPVAFPIAWQELRSATDQGGVAFLVTVALKK